MTLSVQYTFMSTEFKKNNKIIQQKLLCSLLIFAIFTRLIPN